MHNKLVKFSAVLGLLAILALPALALAQTQSKSVAIPGSSTNNTSSAPGAFVANFYQFALLIGGILAFGAIVFGGVKYVISAGNPSAQSDGKEWIYGALIGLLLLAGAYLILKVINPQLLNLSPATLNAVNVATNNTNTTQPSTGPCPITPLPLPLTDPQAEAMENGQTVIWTSSDAPVQQNLSALQAAYSKFQTVIASVGDKGTVNSVYRPLQYQNLFYTIYQDATQYGIYASQSPNNSYTQNPACSSVVSQLESEETKHGVCRTSSQCLVAKATNCDPHVGGRGIDISLTGPVSYSGINALLTQNNVPLQWQALGSNDPVHFNLQNPPAGTCPL